MPRAYWNGYLRLSLVTCPIELFPATSQAEKTHFHQINTQTGHRLHQQMVDEDEWRIGQHPIDPVHIFTFLYPGPEPNCLTRPVSEHDQPHIRSPLETAAPTSRLRRAGAQANETILPIGISVHGLPRFVHPDPPELIRSWKICESAERLSSGGLHHGSLNDDASGDIFPQRHQQLARQRHDSRLLHAAAVAFDSFFEPQSQRRLRLMAQPQPCELDESGSQ